MSITLREQFALAGRMALDALPFWYMGIRGAVAELVAREEASVELMMLTGRSQEECAAIIREYASDTLYPDWEKFREHAIEIIVKGEA